MNATVINNSGVAADNLKPGHEHGGIDAFRVVAALLIVGIHTYPLYSVNIELDFLFTHVLSRIAVPFFLVATGYFVLAPCLTQKSKGTAPPWAFVKKTVLIYAGATLLYLPIGTYAGHYSGENILATILRGVVFDGTFYHLWYLPACLLGVLLLYAISRLVSMRALLVISLALYGLGLLGDSYYSLTAEIPILRAIYDAGFTVFSYTRNGLFYAPIFLTLGAFIALRPQVNGKKSLVGFTASLALMLLEGWWLHQWGWQRHDSMYLMLVPCLFFLFQFLLTLKGGSSPFLRGVSLWVYILHPAVIVAVRGAAKIAGLTGLLVENSVVHYLAVCLLSLAASMFIVRWGPRRKRLCFKKGRAWVEIYFDNLRHNADVLRQLLPEKCQLMPTVKANAYGHGAVAICRELNRHGIRAFCVASAAEGVELRKHHIQGEILVLGYTHPAQFHLLRRYRLTQTVIDCEYARTLDAYGKKLAVHVKIDTGMRRLGEKEDNIDGILQIFNHRHLDVNGIYTHLCADDKNSAADQTFTQTQMANFRKVLSAIKAHGFVLPKVHMQSSYGVLNHPELSCDYARVGIALYGLLSECEDTRQCGIELRPVLSLKSRVSAIKTVHAGEAVGYARAFTAPRDMTLAILSIGYADGIPRALSCGGGGVLVSGHKVPVVGRICMDQMAVDVTGIENVKQGGIAVLIGESGDEGISACELARQAGTISNEILSRLGARLERVYDYSRS